MDIYHFLLLYDVRLSFLREFQIDVKFLVIGFYCFILFFPFVMGNVEAQNSAVEVYCCNRL